MRPWIRRLTLDYWQCGLGQGTLVTCGLRQGTWYLICWVCDLGQGNWFLFKDPVTLDKVLVWWCMTFDNTLFCVYSACNLDKTLDFCLMTLWPWTRALILIWWVCDLGQDTWFVFGECATMGQTNDLWCPLSKLARSDIMSGGVIFCHTMADENMIFSDIFDILIYQDSNITWHLMASNVMPGEIMHDRTWHDISKSEK